MFVGSTISVLKRHFLASGGCGVRVFLTQPALRCHNLSSTGEAAEAPPWTSYFSQLGAVAPASEREACLEVTSRFLAEALGDRLVLRVSSQDRDLTELAERSGVRIERDGCGPHTYRHRFGVEGLEGRNLNFACELTDGALRDIGNFILIEGAGAMLGVEVAFGLGTILQCRYELAHPIQAYEISRLYAIGSTRDLKAADCLAAAQALLAEGLRPSASNRGRVLRRYLRALSALRRPGEDGLDEIRAAVDRSELAPSVDGARVAGYLATFERLSREEATPTALAAALSLHL